MTIEEAAKILTEKMGGYWSEVEMTAWGFWGTVWTWARGEGWWDDAIEIIWDKHCGSSG